MRMLLIILATVVAVMLGFAPLSHADHVVMPRTDHVLEDGAIDFDDAAQDQAASESWTPAGCAFRIRSLKFQPPVGWSFARFPPLQGDVIHTPAVTWNNYDGNWVDIKKNPDEFELKIVMQGSSSIQVEGVYLETTAANFPLQAEGNLVPAAGGPGEGSATRWHWATQTVDVPVVLTLEDQHSDAEGEDRTNVDTDVKLVQCLPETGQGHIRFKLTGNDISTYEIKYDSTVVFSGQFNPNQWVEIDDEDLEPDKTYSLIVEPYSQEPIPAYQRRRIDFTISGASVIITDYPHVPDSDKAAYYANCTAAFPVEFEVLGLGGQVELEHVALIVTGGPKHANVYFDCDAKYTVTPASRNANMYVSAEVPEGAVSNKFTLFAKGGWLDWDDIDCEIPNGLETTFSAELEYRVKVTAKVDGASMELESEKKTLVFWDCHVPVAEYLVERTGEDRLDFSSNSDLFPYGLSNGTDNIIITHRGDDYEDLRGGDGDLPRNGNANPYFPRTKELNKNSNEMHSQHTYYYEDLQWIATQKWQASRPYDDEDFTTYGVSPHSGLAHNGTDGDYWRAIAYTWGDDHYAKATIWPKGDAGQVCYQRVSMVAEIVVPRSLYTYYRAIPTGLPAAPYATYWKGATGTDDDSGYMDLLAFKNWHRRTQTLNLDTNSTPWDWNTSGALSGAIQIGVAVASGDPIVITGAVIAHTAIWAMGVEGPHGSRPGVILVAQLRTKIDYGVAPTSSSTVYFPSGVSEKIVNRAENDENPIEVLHENLMTKPCRWYSYTLTGMVGVNQTNVQGYNEPKSECIFELFAGEGADEDDFYRVEITIP
jgi:hypothetical protein